jgi:hypothetical protein
MFHEILEEICLCNTQFLIFFLTLPTFRKILLPPSSEWTIEIIVYSETFVQKSSFLFSFTCTVSFKCCFV